MTPLSALMWLIGYVSLLAVAGGLLVLSLDLDPERAPGDVTIVSVWQRGQRIARSVAHGDPSSVLRDGLKRRQTRVFERIVDEGPVLSSHPLVLAVSLVSARDGLLITYDGRDIYLTPDDLLRHQLYGKERMMGSLRLEFALDSERTLALAAEEAGATVEALRARGRFRRFVVKRTYPDRPPDAAQEPPLSDQLRRSAMDAAGYLSRHVRADGLFDYELRATDAERLAGYSWPRHAGATYYLAEAARLGSRPDLRRAALLAAQTMRINNTQRCGSQPCVGTDNPVNIGSSALAVLAYVEIIEGGADEELLAEVRGLCSFLRTQQRPDGEFMHEYDLARKRRIDVQHDYYSGEATLALSRAHRVTKDSRDLAAARKGLRFLAETNRAFIGNRYIYDAQHWTCQALEDLWQRAPNPEALEFCVRWQKYLRKRQIGPSTELGEYDGGYNELPWLIPRIAGAGSRSEAGVATLVTGLAAGIATAELEELEDQQRRALRYLLRNQFSPGPNHLFVNPRTVHGGYPGSPHDWRIRIDLPQHAGSAMIRYIRLLEDRSRGRVAPRP